MGVHIFAIIWEGNDDYFLEFEKSNLDSNIIESDDDGLENDAFIINKKYWLENVDCDM